MIRELMQDVTLGLVLGTFLGVVVGFFATYWFVDSVQASLDRAEAQKTELRAQCVAGNYRACTVYELDYH